MKKIRLFFMTILVSVIFMGCGQATKNESISSENTFFGIPEMKKVDPKSKSKVNDTMSFAVTALLVFLI